jgi:hypothetical protein
MVKKWKLRGEVNEKLTLNVSASGSGLYLHLPKDLCNTYDIIGGERIKVHLVEVYGRDWPAEEEEEKRGDKKRKRSSEF